MIEDSFVQKYKQLFYDDFSKGQEDCGLSTLNVLVM